MGGGPSKAELFCEDLKIGDLIEFRHDPTALSHWAVYVGVQLGKHSVIHMVIPSLQKEKQSSSFSIYNKSNKKAAGPSALHMLKKEKFQYSARISMDSIEEIPDFQCDCARVNNDDDQRHKPLSENKIMAAALNRVGETIELHAIANNCEHFAKSCRYGLKLSGQSTLLVVEHYELIQELCKTDECLNDYVQSIIRTSTKTENIDQHTNINAKEEKEHLKSISDDLELKDRNLRKYNVIIFGLPDASHNVTWIDDVLIIQKLLEDLNLVKALNIPKNVVDIKRLGKYDPSRKRPLILKFNTIENKDLFFQTANVLIKHLPNYANVSDTFA